ncbi:acyltransferase family protein [Glaciecola sp. 1036]|uniref:acyltransferase family protein n=1 Tax=Alteromonadaceae TaxID=72275 RepID=UPI003CFD92C7
MNRELSLDIFRGITLAAMILVNNPGSWSYVYAPLLHAKWHGITPTDLVFPFFLFIVGAAMFHSFQRISSDSIPWFKIVKRTFLLFFIGLLLRYFPFTGDLSELRIMGVLQRIALCYCLGAFIVLLLPKVHVWTAIVILLLGYFFAMSAWDPTWSLENNLVREIDLFIFGPEHMYTGFGIAFDPEGLFSTLPATATLLLGYKTSAILSKVPPKLNKIFFLLVWAVIAASIALVWREWQPINKPLWTGSYVLITAACAWGLLIFILITEKLPIFRQVFHVAQIFGSNPLFIYVLSGVVAISLSRLIHVPFDGETISAYHALFRIFASVMSPYNASLLFALVIVFFHLLVALWLYKRNIYIKI